MKPVALIEGNAGRRHRLIAKQALAAPGQALVVAPEIWLLERLRAAFPAGAPVQTMHAGLTVKEQARCWQDVHEAKRVIIIGTQKALWLPWRRLSKVIVEEEFFPTHKLWDQYPRLSNVEGASVLADLSRAALVWSGSFPSLRLHYGVGQRQVTPAVWRPLRPRAKIIQTTYQDRRRGWLLPQQLVEELQASVRRRERVVVLRNRHGALGPAKIQALLTKLLGRHSRLLVETAALFARLQDTTADRVVWLFPEDSIFYPDFRSAERAWYTLARLQQLAGPRRAVTVVCRGQWAERVAAILNDDPRRFYEDQLAERARLGYPPWRDLVRLTVRARTVAGAQQRAEKLRRAIEPRLPAGDEISLRGPFASFEATAGPERHLLLAGPLARLRPLYSGQAVERVDVNPERIV